RDRHEPAGLCDHYFGIPAIMMNTAVFLVPAVHEIAIAAELTIAAGPCKKTYTHPLTNRTALNTGTKRIDPPDDLVTRTTPVADTGETSIHCRRIRVADATRLNPQPHLARTRLRKQALDKIQCTWTCNLNCSIGIAFPICSIFVLFFVDSVSLPGRRNC